MASPLSRRIRRGLTSLKGLAAMVFAGRGGVGGFGSSWMRLLMPGADYDYETQAGDLWRNTAAASCLRVLKINFPQPKLRVKWKAGPKKGEVNDASVLPGLFDKPNQHYDKYALWGAFVLSAIVDGNGYILKIRSAAGIPRELWWVPPWQISPCWPADGSAFISHYEYHVDGRIIIVPPEDVIHYRHGGLDPHNDRKGISDLKAALRAICGLNEADGFIAAILRNMGIPGVVISPSKEGGRIGADDVPIIKQQWKERLTGENRGEPFVATGPISVVAVGFSPEQMALDKIPARLEDQICSLTGVNAMVAGLTSGAQHKTYANYAEARRAFYEDTLIPFQAAVACCLDNQLLNDVGIGNSKQEECEWSYEGIPCMAEDKAKLLAAAGKAYKQDEILRRGEARKLAGYDSDPEDEVYYSDTKPEPQPNPFLPGLPPPVDPGVVDDTTKHGRRSEREDDDDPFPGTRDGKSIIGPGDGNPFIPGIHSEDNTFGLPEGEPISAKLREFFREQLKSVLGTLDTIGAGLPSTFLPLADYDDPMASAMTPLLATYWNESGKDVRERLGLDPDNWKVTDPHLAEKIQTASFDFCAATNATTTKDLNTALAKLREEMTTGLVTEGESVKQLTKRVKSVFENASDDRAYRIAQTESSRAWHSAQLQSAKETGIVIAKKLMLSANSCPLCVKVHDAQPKEGIPLDSEFAHIGNNPTYASIITPPLHPMCRCSMQEVLIDDAQTPVIADDATRIRAEVDDPDQQGKPLESSKVFPKVDLTEPYLRKVDPAESLSNGQAIHDALLDPSHVPVKSIKASLNLIATEVQIDRAKVAELLAKLDAGETIDGPLVAKFGKQYFIIGGHEAAAALRATTKKTYRVHLLDLGKAPAEAKPPKPQPKPKTIAEKIAGYKDGDKKVAKLLKIGDQVAKQRAAFEAAMENIAKFAGETPIDELTTPENIAKFDAMQKIVDDTHAAMTKSRRDATRKALDVLKVPAKDRMPINGLDATDPTYGLPKETAKTTKSALKWLSMQVKRNDADAVTDMYLSVYEIPKGDKEQRAYAKRSQIFITSENGPDVIVHEAGHVLEGQRASSAAQAFLKHRVGDESLAKLKDIFPTTAYKDNEYGRKDDFEKTFAGDLNAAYYTGKHYEHGSTEILSMGVQLLYNDPIGFARRDPEYFKFVTGILDGTIR